MVNSISFCQHLRRLHISSSHNLHSFPLSMFQVMELKQRIQHSWISIGPNQPSTNSYEWCALNQMEICLPNDEKYTFERVQLHRDSRVIFDTKLMFDPLFTEALIANAHEIFGSLERSLIKQFTVKTTKVSIFEMKLKQKDFVIQELRKVQ